MPARRTDRPPRQGDTSGLRARNKFAVRIDGRPAIVDSRRRFGDWEGDTIVGLAHRGGLLSLVERKSGFTLLARVSDRRAATIRAVAEDHLAALPDALCRTVTFDNGKEFAEHERLSAATGIDVYFAHPYAAWERGAFEIHFPKRFTLWMKVLRHLGDGAYFAAVRRSTGL